MANDIVGVTYRAPVSHIQPNRPAGLQASSPVGSSSSQDDSVSLNLTKLLADSQAILAQTPTVNEARVRALANAIAEGRYQPDIARVAAKLIEFESSLSNAINAEPHN